MAIRVRYSPHTGKAITQVVAFLLSYGLFIIAQFWGQWKFSGGKHKF